jgi:hypothetical protein
VAHQFAGLTVMHQKKISKKVVLDVVQAARVPFPSGPTISVKRCIWGRKVHFGGWKLFFIFLGWKDVGYTITLSLSLSLSLSLN